MKHDFTSFEAAKAYRVTNETSDIIRQFMPMVQRAAWHIHSLAEDELEVEELVQIGLIALSECAQKHEGELEDGFAAYAKLRVRGSMFDHLRKVLPDTRNAVKKRRIYEDAVERLGARLGRPASPSELAAELGWTENEIFQAEGCRLRITSIEEEYDENNLAFADERPNPFEELAVMDERKTVVAALEQLPDRLKLILQLFFVEELNLTEIAAVLEVSVPRVHQLRAQALGRMRMLIDCESAQAQDPLVDRE